MDFNNKRILSFGAHPDDIEIGCAGTEYYLLQNKGCVATHVYVTSGEAGSREITRDKLAGIRELEAITAAKVLGVKEVRFLRCSDGLTDFSAEIRAKVINIIREVRPHIVFVHGRGDAFPDHMIVHDLVMSAIQGASGPWFQETKGEPWPVSHVFGYEVWNPINAVQCVVDITQTIEKKVEALNCFKSQLETKQYDEAFKGLARYRGVMCDGGTYAEGFEVLKTGFN
jgi:N-acetylglucosamine malate deacetylase 1